MLVYVVCALIICGVCLYLLVHPQYEDGLIGGLGLVILLVSELIIFCESMAEHYSVLPTTIGLQAGITVLLTRQLIRFELRRRRGGPAWYDI